MWYLTNRKWMNGVIMPMVNVKPVKLGKNVRMSFSRIGEVLEMPNLIEVQKNSYQWFLDEGLKEVFHDVSPITDYQGNLVLECIRPAYILSARQAEWGYCWRRELLQRI